MSASSAASSDNVPTRGGVDGGTFIFDIPDGIPARWGEERHVLWAIGEPLMIAGPQGVGKTTDLGQLAFGLCGLHGFEELYGFPLLPVDGKVVYLALDRPQQIARALRRMAWPAHRTALSERLHVHQGPLDFNILKQPPGQLSRWVTSLGGCVVLVDSLKDLAAKLSDEEVGAKLNAAFQECIADGIDVGVAHHNRKPNADNKHPRALADIHGSENLTRGMGSIISLYGVAGDTEVEFTHLKQPGETVGPYVITRDHKTGRSWIASEGRLTAGSKADRARAIRGYFLASGGIGTTLTRDDLLATSNFGKDTAIDEALTALVDEGTLEHKPGGGRGNESTWTLVSLPGLTTNR